MELPTHYESSRGRIPIASMMYPHLVNAHRKMLKDQGPSGVTRAMEARIAELDAMQDDAARIAATTPSTPPIGHNSGDKPAVVWDRDLIKSRIDDLYEQAQGILDGEPIANEGQAELVAKLKAMIAEAEGEAEKLRKAEAKKWDDGKAEVQSFFNPLIANTTNQKGLTTRAIRACEALLTPWLLAVQKDLQDRQVAATAAANAKIAEAQTLAGAADMTNLADAETVDTAYIEAKAAVCEVAAVEKERPRVTTGGFGRGTLLKDNWTATLLAEGGDDAVDWAIKYHRAEMETFLTELATKAVKVSKGAPIPGFRVWNDQRAG